MSATASTETAEVKALKLEVNYWKNRYELYEQKLKGMSNNCSCIAQHNPYVIKVETALEASKQLSFNPNITEITIEKLAPIFSINGKRENPNIQKIVINYFDEAWRDWFKMNNFPSIEELHIDYTMQTRMNFNDHLEYSLLIEENLDAILSGMKKNLKILYLRTEFPYDLSFDLPDLESADVISIDLVNRQKLKKLKLSEPINCTRLLQIYNEFKGLKVLKTVVELFDSEIKINKNENITTLNIQIERDIEQNFLKKVLQATPSLKILVLYVKIKKSILNFLAHNMTNLNKLYCRGGIEDGVFEHYQDMRQSQEVINKGITIVLQETRTWQEEFFFRINGKPIDSIKMEEY